MEVGCRDDRSSVVEIVKFRRIRSRQELVFPLQLGILSARVFRKVEKVHCQGSLRTGNASNHGRNTLRGDIRWIWQEKIFQLHKAPQLIHLFLPFLASFDDRIQIGFLRQEPVEPAVRFA